MAKIEMEVCVETTKEPFYTWVEFEDEGDEDYNIEMACDLASKQYYREGNGYDEVLAFIVDNRRYEV